MLSLVGAYPNGAPSGACSSLFPQSLRRGGVIDFGVQLGVDRIPSVGPLRYNGKSYLQ